MSMLESILWLVAGGTVLILGGELLVRGASKLATLLKISPLVVGLTVVAVCTGAPETAVSLTGILADKPNADIAVGNVVGSNICNILLILGLSALLRPIGISSRLVKREIPLLIFVSALTWIFGFVTFRTADGVHAFPRWGGLVFLAIYLVYNIWVIRSVRRGDHAEMSEQLEAQSAADGGRGGVFLRLLGSLTAVAVGLGLLVWGANHFVLGAVEMGKMIGVSELIISLTVLAVGTSLPELAVSLIAAWRGKNDIAIGNVVGSNTYNLLGILGLSSTLSPDGLALSNSAFWIDMPIMAVVAVFGSVLCVTDRKLSRWEGAALLLCYGGYVLYLFVR